MENLTKQSSEPTPKKSMRRGIGLAWLTVLLGYVVTSIFDMGQFLPSALYGLLAPQLVAVGIAIILFLFGKSDVAGGVFLGLISIIGVLTAFAIILLIYFSNNPPQIVNGWK
ncbi:hypothetical protein G3O06_00220 [Burkholderia sp. Ac-20345]|uniref:hypothetical protein n=1 Tax=Burkholderia sp. Ac-20345 TaxID=2703891 RepID=UPI00197B4235|nr:hypothetical protein [Burkholderia sp. Ac-20345]MBN3775989.1 hypothetical protein [Burkholderia sp. Ac-20345]